MNVNDFLGIVVVGSALSLLIEWVTAKYGTGKFGSKLVALVFSVVIGGLYWWVSSLAIWESVLGVLATASTVYAFFFNNK